MSAQDLLQELGNRLGLPEADALNADGVVDAGDVDPFAALLLNQ